MTGFSSRCWRGCPKWTPKGDRAMPRYVYSENTRRDLEDIRKWIARGSPASARRLIQQFLAQFQMICRQPLIGESCDDLRPGLRFVLVGNYVVYNRIEGGRIIIVRVVHGARDSGRVFPKNNGH